MKKGLTALALSLVISACGTAENNIENDLDSNGQQNAPEQNTNQENETENNVNQNKVPSNSAENQQQNENKINNGTFASGSLEVHFIDAGQADATLFLHDDGEEEFSILYDNGDWRRTDVVSYLHGQALDGIDILIGSHPHADHIGQMDVILNEFDVEEVWMSGDDHTSATYERVLDAIHSSEAVYEEPRVGDAFQVGELNIDILNPKTLTGDLHAGSIGMRLSFGEHSFLLTGDAEVETEQAMIDRDLDLSATVLHLGHHGSRTSTSQSFLDAVDPAYSIISADADNSYGHPHSEVVNRIDDFSIETYGTYVHGTILFSSDGVNLDIETERTGEITPGPRQDSSVSGGEDSGSNVTVPSGECIDINSASRKELQAIIHIGEARSEALIEHRPYSQVQQLTRIHGIGDGRIRDIQDEGIACIKGD